jgi:hypothetical protein
MATIKLKVGCVVDKVSRKAGAKIETSEETAKLLVGLNLAQRVESLKAKKTD